uniref:CoA transferase n=1 Tax=Halorientalis sp. TaxID=1931229 RepID=UPI00262A68E2
SPDPIRNWPPEQDGTSLWRKSLARNKRCVTSDLGTDEGRAGAGTGRRCRRRRRELPAGSARRWDLGPERLHETSDELILVRISGYGQTGPKANEPGSAPLPRRCPASLTSTATRTANHSCHLSLADMVAGQTAVQGLLLALFERDVTGSGDGQ